MEESLVIFAIPAFFVLVCLLFISANHFYYKFKGQHQERVSSKISVINISNVASSSPPSPKTARKQRRKRSKSPKSSKSSLEVKNSNKIPFPDHFYLSPVIHLDHHDCPPSYQSLYAYETDSNSNPGKGTDNVWLHPSSAAALPAYHTVEDKPNNCAAVLHL